MPPVHKPGHTPYIAYIQISFILIKQISKYQSPLNLTMFTYLIYLNLSQLTAKIRDKNSSTTFIFDN